LRTLHKCTNKNGEKLPSPISSGKKKAVISKVNVLGLGGPLEMGCNGGVRLLKSLNSKPKGVMGSLFDPRGST